MDRSGSISPRESESYDDASNMVPPWERRTVARVPFVTGSLSPHSRAERAALPELRAMHASTTSRSVPTLRAGSKRCSSEDDIPSLPTSPGQSISPWRRDSRPSISTPLQTSPAPYETQFYVPPAPQSAPPATAYVPARAPPTPPESLSNSPEFSCPATSPPRTHSAAKALPGTMSSRNRAGSRVRPKVASRTRSAPIASDAQSVPFRARFKSVFREMFKRDAIDESQFERIEDRHWTDEN